MFDIGWTELLVIGIVALIVVGPKDLPGMFRTLGRFTAKMRSMAREFQRTMEQAADEAGVRDVADDLRKVASARNLGLDAVQQSAMKFKGGWKSGLGEPGSATTGSNGAAAGPAPGESSAKEDDGAVPGNTDMKADAEAPAEAETAVPDTGNEPERKGRSGTSGTASDDGAA